MKKLFPQVGSSAAAVGVSWLLSSQITPYVAVSVLAGTLWAPVVTTIVSSVLYWGSCRLLNWAWNKIVGSPEERELWKLMKKYNLDEKATWHEVRQAFKAQCLKTHPDKPGGSHEAFQKMNADFARVAELRLLLEKKRNSKGDSIRSALWQFFRFDFWCSSNFPRNIINKFRAEDVTEKEMQENIQLLESVSSSEQYATNNVFYENIVLSSQNNNRKLRKGFHQRKVSLGT